MTEMIDTNPKSVKTAGGRIIGIDIARILAMFFVVAVHVNGFGLPYVGSDKPSLAYNLVRLLMQALFMTCVNIFAIVSGYVGVKSSFKLWRILELWFRVVFTGLAVLIIMDLFLDVCVPKRTYVGACMPVIRGHYWYVTAYMFLLLVKPIINAGVTAIPKEIFIHVLMALLLLICGESFVFSSQALGVRYGYSFTWILVLYLVGAYIRIYDVKILSVNRCLVLGLFSLLFSAWMPLAIKALHFEGVVGNALGNLGFVQYTSPFTVVLSVCIFTLCLRVRISSEFAVRLIKMISTTTLGVYLIHVQPAFWQRVFVPYCSSKATYGLGSYLVSLFSISILCFIICSTLDAVRQRCVRLVYKLMSYAYAGDGFCVPRRRRKAQ